MSLLKRIKKGYQGFSNPDVTQVFEVNEQGKGVVKEYYDGTAEFLGEGTHDEFEEQEKADKGLLPWYKRILRNEDE